MLGIDRVPFVGEQRVSGVFVVYVANRRRIVLASSRVETEPLATHHAVLIRRELTAA